MKRRFKIFTQTKSQSILEEGLHRCDPPIESEFLSAMRSFTRMPKTVQQPCSAPIALFLCGILLPRAFCMGGLIAGCILAICVALRRRWWQTRRLEVEGEYLRHVWVHQRLHAIACARGGAQPSFKQRRSIARRLSQQKRRVVKVRARRRYDSLGTLRDFLDTMRRHPVKAELMERKDRQHLLLHGCKSWEDSTERVEVRTQQVPNAVAISYDTDDVLTIKSVSNSCGQPVATPCLVHGGCFQHQQFWLFQHQQSGGRRTFQHLHDPAWQVAGAIDVPSAPSCMPDEGVPTENEGADACCGPAVSTTAMQERKVSQEFFSCRGGGSGERERTEHLPEPRVSGENSKRKALNLHSHLFHSGDESAGAGLDIGGRMLSVHNVSVSDIASGAVAPTQRSGVLLYEGDDMPPQYQGLFGESSIPYCGLLTRGDGACGLHAVFGRPKDGILRCELGIRRFVADHFGRYIHEVQGGIRLGSSHYEKVRSTWWSELCLPSAQEECHMAGSTSCASSSSSVNAGAIVEPEAEARCFWESLSSDGKQLACSHLVEAAKVEISAVDDRASFASVARRCCDEGLERHFFRPLAIISGFLPADVSIDYLELADAERLQYLDEYPSQSEFLCEPFYVKANGDCIVRGTQDTPFPYNEPNPPRHKYAAVFDSRPCFDAIRSHFLRPTLVGAEARGREMFRLLDELHDQGEQGALKEKGYKLASMLMQDRHSASLLPAGFMNFATQAYLKAIQNTQYYFSCEELLWIAECAQSDVIIAKSEGDHFRVEGAEFGGVGPVAVIYLQGEGQRRLRTHYERLCPQDLVHEGKAIAAVVAQERAGVTAKATEDRIPTSESSGEGVASSTEVAGIGRAMQVDNEATATRAEKAKQEDAVEAKAKEDASSGGGVASSRPTDTVGVDACVRSYSQDSGTRSEEAMKALLIHSLGYSVRDTTAHGENNCLIEAVLCALHSQGYLVQMSVEQRREVCRGARTHLIEQHGLSSSGFVYLSHDVHFDPICNYLRSRVPGIWPYSFDPYLSSLPHRLTITAQVFTRWDRVQVLGARGEVDELREVDPVSSLADLADLMKVEEAVIYLYCNTSDGGDGWHYEWILPSSVEAEPGDYDAIPEIPYEDDNISNVDSLDSWFLEDWRICEDEQRPWLEEDVIDFEQQFSARLREEPIAKGPREEEEIEDSLEDESPVTLTLTQWMSTARVLCPQPFLTEQDQDQSAARLLARDLRTRPTLPPDLGEPSKPFLDVESGLKLPVSHCAFRGCKWVGEKRDDIKPHIHSKHRARIIEVCGHRAQDHVFDFYCEAIAVHERNTVPQIGFSIDRRSIAQTVEVYNDECIKQLVCFVCSQSKTSVPHVNSLIEYKPAAWLCDLSPTSLRLNLDFACFRARYASSGPLAGVPGLEGWEWRRVLQCPGRDPTILICCPEDVYCNSKHAAHILCPGCQIPICRDCRITMTSGVSACAVPMALANDNWYDYAPAIIYQWKVRFIEAAAAAPVWTTMIVYYVEEDHGHLMTETLQQPQYRTAARGNAFSYFMPWEDILKSLRNVCADPDLSMLPHDDEVLARLVGFQLRSHSNDVTTFFKQAKLRAHVVLKLLYLLIEREHTCFRGKGSVEQLRQRMREAVASRYPDGEESHLPESQRQGIIPPAVLREMELAQLPSKKSPSLVYDKAATPAERSEHLDSLDQTIRPSAIVEERHADTTLDCNAAHALAFKDFGTLKVQTGSSFVDQWKP